MTIKTDRQTDMLDNLSAHLVELSVSGDISVLTVGPLLTTVHLL